MVKAQVKRLSGVTATEDQPQTTTLGMETTAEKNARKGYDPRKEGASERKARLEELLPIVAVQTEDERAQALSALRRLGKGIVMWQEQGWEWEDPAPGSAPEDFPPLAKLLWLFNRAYTHMNNVGAMEHLHRPWYCHVCQENPGEWMAGLCDDHIDHADSAKRWARWLGLRGDA